MNRSFALIILLVIACINASAQKMSSSPVGVQYAVNPCNASFAKITFEGANNTGTIEKLLPGLLPNLQNPKVSIKLNYVNESLAGFHYSYTELYAGVPVYQSEIKVNTDKHNVIHSILDNSYNTRGWNLTIPVDSKNPIIAVNPNTGEPVVAELSMINHNLETLTANGIIIFQRDVNSYYQGQDSTVTGKVFNPDPLTTSQHFYTDLAVIITGDTIYSLFNPDTLPSLQNLSTNILAITKADTVYYDNHNGADEAWMDAQQQEVSFTATYNNGVFLLQSPYVILTEYDTFAPNVPPATSTTPQFNFNRSQSGFQDVNAFYHISTHRNYVAGLGFNCGDSLVLADTHALSEDNSYFSPSYYPRQIFYGVGGVPDAEDADVVVHEYCHSLSYNCAPGSNVGLERQSLDEAFCDYNAAAYSKVRSTFNDEWVYNWDGHNQYWPGRVVNSTDVYPAALTEDIYTNGQMWSAVLFALNGEIGRGATDSIIYQTHYSYAQNISMAHAAMLLIDADSLLFNGAHYCNIYELLLQHGFVNATANGCTAPSSISNVANNDFRFVQTGNAFTLYNGGTAQVHIQLLTITGQLVAPAMTIRDAVFNYQNPNLASGVYLVNVISDSGTATFKWINAGR
jgi:hypothetical protein